MFSNTGKNVYPFCYRAIVVDNNDPELLGRIRLKVPEIFGENLITDWAFGKVGITGSDGTHEKGDFHIPNIGDAVWCEFESGNPNYPVWSGTWYSQNTPPPALAQGTADSTVQSVFPATPEVKDPYAAKYPYNHVFKTLSGHTVEFDDTPEHERIKIYHASGTFVDIDTAGNVRIKVVGNVYSEVNGDVSERIHGDVIRVIEGNHTQYVIGDEELNVDGYNTTTVKGEFVRNSDTHIVDNAPRIDHN